MWHIFYPELVICMWTVRVTPFVVCLAKACFERKPFKTDFLANLFFEFEHKDKSLELTRLKKTLVQKRGLGYQN